MNGEAIYSSTPWQYQNDTANSQVWYTAKGDSVYAFSLGWPEEDQLILGALGVPGEAKIIPDRTFPILRALKSVEFHVVPIGRSTDFEARL